MKIAISTVIAGSEPLDRALGFLEASGFRAVEMSYVSPHHEALLDPGSRQRVVQRLLTLGMKVSSFHLPHRGLDMTALDADLREQSLHEIERFMAICSDVGCEVAILHPNGYRLCTDEALFRQRQGRMIGALERLLPLAERLGVTLALENMVWYEGARFGCDHRDLRQVADEFDHPNLGLCVDTTHAAMRGLDPAEQIRIAGPRLIATHLSDDDGGSHGHWIPGHGSIDWQACWQALRESPYAGPWTFEVYEQPEQPTYLQEMARFSAHLCMQEEAAHTSAIAAPNPRR